MSNFNVNNEQDGLELFFKKRLESASMEPSEGVWDAIELDLDAEEKKKKRRFFWFFMFGAGILIGVLGTMFYTGTLNVFADSKVLNGKTSKQVKLKSGAKQLTDKANKNYDTSAVLKPNDSMETRIEEKKIQLGAFKKVIDESIFNNVGLPVKSELLADGLTRYYAISNNPERDLNTLQQKGFKDAFIRKDESNVNSNSLIAVLPTTSKLNAQNNSDKTTTLNQSVSLDNKEPSKNDLSVLSKQPESVGMDKPLDEPKKIISNQKEIMQQSSIVANNKNEEIPLKKEEQKKIEFEQPKVLESIENREATSQINKDSIQKQEDKNEASQVTLKDSVPKRDTSKTQKTQIDAPFERWAFSALGGTNIFLNSAETNLFNASNEKRAIKPVLDFKIDYSFLKNFSISAGIGYQQQSVEMDSTYFRFSKYITSDYIVHSSMGDLAIDRNVLLQGFNLAFPIDTFWAAYRYKSTLHAINVPVNAQGYIINGERFKMFANAGVNINYSFAQVNKLYLYKEHSIEDLGYKGVGGNKLNLLLILGMGCDVRLTNKLYFTFNPSYRYCVTDYSKVSGVSFKPNNISIVGGLKWRF